MSRKQQWWRWHKSNPQVYEAFERFAFEAIGKGHRRLSAWLVMNRVRWETTIETRGGDFKVSNDFIAYYARLFHALNPEYDGFFVTKTMKEEREKESGHADSAHGA